MKQALLIDPPPHQPDPDPPAAEGPALTLADALADLPPAPPAPDPVDRLEAIAARALKALDTLALHPDVRGSTALSQIATEARDAVKAAGRPDPLDVLRGRA